MRASPTPIGIAVSFAVAVVLFGALERTFATLPRPSIWRRERRPDFAYWLFMPFATRALARVTLFLAFAAATLFAARPASGWFERQPLLLQALETLIAADLIGYGAHRIFHRGRLWRFHAVHHSSPTLDWLAAARVHPVNEALMRVAQFLPLYLVGFNGKAIAAALPLLTVYAVFLHANVPWDFGPLRYVIATPLFHRWHHTSQEEGLDRNFAGLFPWIDLLFGTYYLPAGRQPEVFGVAEAVPKGLAGQLIWPFRSQ